jgi:hypothetical protein
LATSEDSRCPQHTQLADMISKIQSKAPTVEAYLRSLPENCRAAIGAVRNVILKNLDANYMSLYLMSVCCGCEDDNPRNQRARWFREAWARTGKKLDMGKACIRFKKVEDLPLDLIGEAVKRVPASTYIEFCEASLTRAPKPAAGKQTAG